MLIRRPILSFVAALVILGGGSSVASAKRVERTQAQHYLDHVKYLAGPELQGRGAGTPGAQRNISPINSDSLGCVPLGIPERTFSRSK